MEWISTVNYLIGRNNKNTLENSKIAGFDLDDTIIKPKSGKKFSDSSDDWILYNNQVMSGLKKLSDEGFNIVFISNQKGLGKDQKKMEMWKKKIENIIDFLGLNISIFASLKDDMYRKPRIGLWNLIKGNIESSFFCGDAAGLKKRVIHGVEIPKDFSDSDLKFALNLGLKFIHRDEFIFDAKYTSYNIDYPVDFKKIGNTCNYTFESKPKEVILCIGLPGSGKSTFVKNKIIPCNYDHINQDTLKTLPKCLSALETSLKNQKNAVIDNTNLSKSNREKFTEICKKYGYTYRYFFFNTPKDICIHNNYLRNYITGGKVDVIPSIVYNMMNKKYEKPTSDEGYEELVEITFSIELDRKIYEKYYF